MTPDITADQTAESNLRQHLDLISALVNNAAAGLYTIDAQARVTFINPAAAQMLGWSASEILGRHVHETIHFQKADGSPYPKDDCPFLEVLRSGESVSNHEDAFTRKDGSLFPILCSSAPIIVDDQVVGTVMSFQDITERKRAEEAAREAGERFRFLAEAMPQKIFTAQPNGDVGYFNQQWTQFTGLSFEQIRDWGWTQFIHPDDVEENIRRWQHSIDTGEPFQFEHRFRRADNEYRWHLSRAHAMRDAQGQVVMWIGSNTDIDEVKRAQEERAGLLERESQAHREAEAARQRLHDLLMQAPAAICTLREPLHIFEIANPLFVQVIGRRDASELIGKPIREAMSELEGQGFFELLDKVYRTGEPFIGNEVVVKLDRRGDGTLDEGFFNFVYQPSRDARGEVDGILVHAVEVTEQVRARQRLEETNRLKDEFLATVSHELRTPLTAIIGWSAMLRTNKFDEAGMASALETIQRNAKAQAQLIEDLMDVSRIITGKLRLDVQRVELAPVIEAAIESVRLAAEAKMIRLETILDPQAGPISGDPARLQQVVWNLLSNAIKFTPKNGRVQVRLERIDSHIEIVVSDTGPGINPDFLPFVFDRWSLTA